MVNEVGFVLLVLESVSFCGLVIQLRFGYKKPFVQPPAHRPVPPPPPPAKR